MLTVQTALTTIEALSLMGFGNLTYQIGAFGNLTEEPREQSHLLVNV